MAIKQVRAQVNGQWYTLTLQSNGRYEANITAPGATSFNQPGGYYNVTVEATNTAGTSQTANADTLEGLKLYVKETIPPVITILSPSGGAYVTNNKQPVVFTITDEAGGSGVKLDSVVVKLDGAPVSAGEVTHSAISNGYSFTYTPAQALGDGDHTVTVDATDNDGNSAEQKSTTFTVDTVPPSINVTAPVEGAVYSSGTVAYHIVTNDSTSSPVTVSATLNDVQQPSPPVVDGEADGSFTGLSDGPYKAIFTATDAAGQSSSVTRNFTVDTSVPKIVSAEITPNPVDAGQTMLISVEVSG